MKIHEYQAKQLLGRFGVNIPKNIVAFSVEEAVRSAQKLSGPVWVVKAQIHAGGRGKGGGVKIAKSLAEVEEYARQILGMQLVTHQTGPAGKKVQRLLIEEGADIQKEYYLSFVVDRGQECATLIASSEGGMDIEEVAAKHPERIHKVAIPPETGLATEVAEKLACDIGIPEKAAKHAAKQMQCMYQAFWESDASLVEINPFVLTSGGTTIALDAKVDFDDNALFRHLDIQSLRDESEEDPAELKAAAHGLSYISLQGNIGCLVNGAGLAMATMDTIKLFGGEPANFLDVGGGASKEKVTEAFRIMLENPNIKAILVNIFGGIMRCDVIAEGLVAATRALSLKVPLVVRMKGTNEDIGKKILKESGLPITTADSMEEAGRFVVKAAA